VRPTCPANHTMIQSRYRMKMGFRCDSCHYGKLDEKWVCPLCSYYLCLVCVPGRGTRAVRRRRQSAYTLVEKKDQHLVCARSALLLMFTKSGEPRCTGNHVMFLTHDLRDGWKCSCCLCDACIKGERWRCDLCRTDYCFSCLAKEGPIEGNHRV